MAVGGSTLCLLGFCLLCVLDIVDAKIAAIVLAPDCSPYTPPDCSRIPQVDSKGNIQYDSYSLVGPKPLVSLDELCPKHDCITLDPHPVNYAYTHPLSGVASTVQYWFCYETLMYTMAGNGARVQANSTLPPGKLEDNWAACQYARVADLMSLGNCRDVMVHTCDDCLWRYYFWVCSVAFPKCTSKGSTVQTTYPATPLTTNIFGPHVNASYDMIRPCQGICNDVVRMCPPNLGFTCPSDSRDYGVWPYCNDFGLGKYV